MALPDPAGRTFHTALGVYLLGVLHGAEITAGPHPQQHVLARIERHLARCRACRRAAATLRAEAESFALMTPQRRW